MKNVNSTIGSTEAQIFLAPEFLFEKIPLNSSFVILGIYAIVGFLPDFFFTITKSPRAILFHGGWVLLIIGSLYFAKVFRKRFFETIQKYELTQYTISHISRSFINRRLFWVFLSLFESYLLFLLLLASPSEIEYTSVFTRALVGWEPLALGSWGLVMVLLVVPIWAEIFVAIWSAMLSTKMLVEEIVLRPLATTDPLGLTPLISFWTKTSLVIITFLYVVSIVDPVVWLSTSGFLGLWTLAFALVQFPIHGSLKQSKIRLLHVMRKRRKQWSEELDEIMARHTPNQDAAGKESTTAYSGLDEVEARIKKMRTWLFSLKTLLGFYTYMTLLSAVVSVVGLGLIWVYY